MKIGIIGLGYVGLTLAIAAANKGIIVYGKEVNPHIIKCLKENHAHFFEPSLDEVIQRVNEKTFFCVEQFPPEEKIDAFIITVGTPLSKGSKTPNFEYIKSALSSLSEVYNGEQLIILRSTVSVGTTRNIVIPFLSQMCGASKEDILVAMCPERTVEGKAVEELSSLPQIISGNNLRSIEIATKLFGKITKRTITVDSIEEAELIKLYCNVYRDTMFAVGNVLCMAAQQFGVDGTKVIRAANDGYPRSNIALPGFVAGPCLEKDAYLLINNMPDCAAKEFIRAERSFNEQLEDLVVDWVERNSKNKKVAISGMAFKGHPETSDLRGSSSVYIAKKLNKRGFKLWLHDFSAYADEMRALGIGTVCSSVEEVCENADVLLVLNNHKNYERLSISPIMKKNNIRILDCWDVCKELQKYIPTKTLGNLLIQED